MSRYGHARISSVTIEPRAICDRCGFTYLHADLQWQYQWAGPKLQNLNMLVCDSCLDVPNEQLRTIRIPPDPTPVINARPDLNACMSGESGSYYPRANFLATQDDKILATQDDGYIVTQSGPDEIPE